MFKTLKKAVSGVLAGLMMVSVLPVCVSAEDATVYFSKNFKSDADIGNSSVRTWNGNCGYGFDSDLDAARFTGKWAEGVSQTGNVYVSPSGLTEATGKIYADYRFRIDNDATKTGYIPLAFESGSSWDHINKGAVPLFVQNGKIYVTSKGNAGSPAVAYDSVNSSFYNAAMQEVCEITKDTWYTVKLCIDMDSDESTFIDYSIYIKDEGANKEYRIKDLQLGLPHTLWVPGRYNITKIGSYSYGYVYANLDNSTHEGGKSNADVDTAYNLYIDYINVRAAQAGDEDIFEEPAPPTPSDDKYMQIDFDSSYNGKDILSRGGDGCIETDASYTNNNDGTVTFKYAGGCGKAYLSRIDNALTNGSIYTEARFKYTGTNDKIVYEPLTLSQNELTYWQKITRSVFIKGNKFYAGSKYTGKTTTAVEQISETNWDNSIVELCNAVPNKWYKIQMRTNVTASTGDFNTYEVCITDEETGAKTVKRDLYLGLPSGNWTDTNYNMSGIKMFKYGAIAGEYSWTTTNATDSTLTMDYVLARKATSDDDAAFADPVTPPTPPASDNFIDVDFESRSWETGWYFQKTGECGYKTDENGNKYYSMIRMNGTNDQYDPTSIYYNTAYDKAGNLVVEGDFRINSTVSSADKEGVFPIFLKTNEDVNKVIRTVYAKNGKLLAVGKMPTVTTATQGISDERELCEIDSTKWYNIKVVLNVDGNVDTVDTFMCQITDKATGEILNTSGPYALGYKNGRWQYSEFNITQIGRIGFGMPHDYQENISCDMDNLKAYEAEPLTVTSSVENGTTGVEPGAVNLTFSHAVSADSISQITLYEKKNGNWTSVTASKVLDSTGKIVTLTADTMKYGKEYRIVIPTTVSAVTGEALEAEVEIIFTTKEMPKVLSISNVKFNGGDSLSALTPGASVKVSADFKNTGLTNNQPATLIVAAYNAEGTMVAVAYKREAIALNATESLEASITLPTADGQQATQVKVFAWDDFESMQEMSDAVIMPR